jgi:hypothetical protein
MGIGAMTASEGHAWNTSVNELLHLFRQSLVALLPFLEAAHIPWREEEAYDQWDAISQTLYEKLIAEPLAWGLGAVDEFALTPYGTRLDDYSAVSFIEVLHDEPSPGATTVLVRFATDARPLDAVEAVLLDERARATDRLERLPLEQCAFRLQHLAPEGRSFVEDVLVPA